MSITSGIPSLSTVLVYAGALFGSVLLTFLLGKWLAGMENEADNATEAAQADAGRQQADTSDQNLNSQTEGLPKG